MKRVALHTLGCKLNFAETSTIGRQFSDRGYTVVPFDQQADVYVLNTCSVTERAESDCRYLVRRVLRQAPTACVILTGCYAQLRPGELAGIDGVDAVLGTSEKFRLFDHLASFEKKETPEIFVSCIDDAPAADPAYSAEVGGRTRAFLKVQDGCDYSCSFCTIPRARGESRSVPPADLLLTARRLAGEGFREIVLTGVNVGDYGRKNGGSLLALLAELDRVDGIERIRISSVEPNLLTRPLIDWILGSAKFCHHFHVPLQSGSGGVLTRMRRRYRPDLYAGLVSYIAASDPDAAIGADVISGFPGETEGEFSDTARFIADLPLSYLHVFTYSGRPGTAAAGMPAQVEPRVRFKRSAILRNIGRMKRRTFHERFRGATVPVLFEQEIGSGLHSGVTQNYIRVEVASSRIRPNDIVPVTITECGEDDCHGVPAPQVK
ncbi:MAG TPA: tRNA (N(6)-L-threonylcarbamoyladenosine(37)-C(2))-methylthiotransferase MtaB [Bacteroidota bacterium]|nr:tRNA (N(6)-L-threonylcarbamoyladenosine(37)-C(2))-methylthiotransferase MtaB [Bacteroidota bacterium]